VDRGGGAPALLRSQGCVAAVLRCGGGADRPTPVVSRASSLVGGLVARRRLRGAFLRWGLHTLTPNQVCASA
jgi:hypothetical protein